MKKYLLILCALLLTAVGASAQTVVHECEAVFNDWSIQQSGSTGTFQQNTWTQSVGDGAEQPWIEYWVWSSGDAILSDATISHTQLTGLSSGYYTVSIFARACKESNSTTSIAAETTYLHANDASVDITTGSMSGVYSEGYEASGTYNLLAQVTDGTLNIYFTLTSVNYSWFFCKNLVVTYLGEDPTLSVVEGYMNAEVEAAMKAAVQAWNESVEEGTNDMDLFATAEAAIQAAEESVAYYAEIAALANALDDAGKAVWETTDTYTGYTNQTLTNDDDFGMDMATAQAAQKEEGTDWSCVARYTGEWTGSTGTIYVGGSAVEERYGDALTGNASNPTKIIYKTLENLPAGTYTVSFYAEANNAWVGAASGSGIAQVFANKTVQNITVNDYTAVGDGAGWLEGDLYTLECNVINGTLEFGLQNIANGGNWYTVMPSGLTLVSFIDSPVIGDASASKTVVQPGDEVTITFEVAVPDNDKTYELVGTTFTTEDGIEVSYDGEGAFSFTVPEDASGSLSVTIPAGQLYYTLDNETVASSEEQTIEFTVSVFGDQYGVYLYNTHADQFLSRGGESSDVLSTWGELAATDVYGIPLDITFGNDGFATIKFLDSQLYLYGDGWAWTDAAEANAGKYAVKELTVDGETVYQFCYNDLDDTYLYVNVQSHNYVASNGNLNGDNNLQGDITRTYWQIYSADERNAHKAARELNDHIEIAAAAGAIVTTEDGFQSYLGGLTETDMTSMVTDAELAGSISGWTEEDYVGNFASDTNGTEIYQGDADLTQTVSGLDAGIYKVTLQGLVRQGSASNIINNNLGVYDLSIGFIEANGYQTNIMPWAEDREKVTGVTLTDSYPSTMAEASNCFSQGLYVNELYTYVGEDGTLEISINCPDALGSGWMIVKNLTLTQYEGETVTWEMTDAGWGTMILPFDADVPSGLTLYAGDALTLDSEGTTITVGEEAESIEANVPYLVKGTEGTYTFSGTSEEATNGLTVGMLTGTLVEMSLADGDFTADSGQYVLQNHTDGEGLAFYQITSESEGVTLEAYHCYLTSDTAPLSVHLPGMATAIKSVESDVIANDAIYDLSGRRVAKAVKGVYIMNGKKVLVK